MNSCQNREIGDYCEIVVINEIQPCEENNIFYKIVEADRTLSFLKTERDSLVLLEFSDSLDRKENYDLFWPPIEKMDHRKFKVGGTFFSTEVGDNQSYGCPGSSRFLVSKILIVDNSK